MTRINHKRFSIEEQEIFNLDTNRIKEIDVIRMAGSHIFYVMGKSGKYRHIISGNVLDGTFFQEDVFKQNYRKPASFFKGGNATRSYDRNVKMFKKVNNKDLQDKLRSSEPVNI